MRPWIGFLVGLVFLTAAVFWPARQYPFLGYDDLAHVRENAYLQPATLESVWYFWRFPFDRMPAAGVARQKEGPIPPNEAMYAPLTFTTWAALTFLARDTTQPADALGQPPLDASIFHSVNLLIHLANTGLVFLLLKRSLGHDLSAFGGALVFGIHPLQVESVCWVTGLNNLLSVFWALLAVIMALRWGLPDAGEQGNPNSGAWPQYLLATFWYVLGLLAKPSAAVAPFLVLALVWALRPAALRRVNWGMALWCTIALAAAAIQMAMRAPDLTSVTVPWLQRPALVMAAQTFYLGKLMRPVQLAADYGLTPHKVLGAGSFGAIWPILVVIAVGVALFGLKGRVPIFRRGAMVEWRLVLAGASFWIVALVPPSGLLPFYFHLYSLVADRYAYFAMAGIAVALAAAVRATSAWAGARRPENKRILMLGASAAGLVVVNLTARQVQAWSSDDALWQRTLAVNPESKLAYFSLAERALAHRSHADALRYADAGLRLEPGNARLWLFRAEALRGQGHWRDAVAAYSAAVQNQPGFVLPRVRAGQLLMQHGQWGMANTVLSEALALEPGEALIAGNLGVVCGNLAQYAEAESHLRTAMAAGLDPGPTYGYLGVALAAQRKWPEALRAFQEGLALGGPEATILYNRGVALSQAGKLAEARRDWQRARQVDPQHALVAQALATTETKIVPGSSRPPWNWN